MLSKGRGVFQKRPELVRRGEAVNTAKLTADQVREIRRTWTGDRTFVSLASEYGLRSPTSIANIVLGRTWRHITPTIEGRRR
jgi:hypothetical protein